MHYYAVASEAPVVIADFAANVKYLHSVCGTPSIGEQNRQGRDDSDGGNPLLPLFHDSCRKCPSFIFTPFFPPHTSSHLCCSAGDACAIKHQHFVIIDSERRA